MEAPKYQAPPIDPDLAATAAKAKADNLTAMQDTAQIDTASMMARYGPNPPGAATKISGARLCRRPAAAVLQRAATRIHLTLGCVHLLRLVEDGTAALRGNAGHRV